MLNEKWDLQKPFIQLVARWMKFMARTARKNHQHCQYQSYQHIEIIVDGNEINALIFT